MSEITVERSSSRTSPAKISAIRNGVGGGDPELIPREVLDVVGSIRVVLEIKFGEKKVCFEIKVHRKN